MDDLYPEFEDIEEESARGDERQNRTFIILVAVMGGLLLVGIIAFCAWAILVGQGMLGGDTADLPTIDPALEIAGLTATAEAAQTETAPSATPAEEPATAVPEPATARPTQPRPTATRPPTAQAGTSGGVTPTSGAAAATTPALQPTATAVRQTPSELSETGLETYAIVILGVGLLFILFMARRLRTAN